jgi:hypothetical protein
MGYEDDRSTELAQDRVQWRVFSVGGVEHSGSATREFCFVCSKFWSKNLKGRDHFGEPKRRWENNVRMFLRELEWELVDWMHMAQDRNQWRAVVNTVMNLRVP